MKKITFLNLGKHPITNNYLSNPNPKKEFFYDLKIVIDKETKIVSLESFIPPKKMFNETYAHRASQSKTMRLAYTILAKKIKKKI